jgi:plasmid stability protein
MSTLTIHDFPDRMRTAFEALAAERGITLEAYVRQLLQEAYFDSPKKRDNMADLAQKYFGPENGIDLDLPSRHSGRELPEFDD